MIVILFWCYLTTLNAGQLSTPPVLTAPVIKVEGLCKRYQVQRAQSQSYTTLRESLTHWFRKKAQNLNQESNFQTEDFWALQDVDFEVQHGEVVGIIGRNGAGKSTLLKILSRITEPTNGRITLRGRVASLLEVGTGFHPELTGRENIFLNGAIMGMKRKEIAARFDEVVAFAEIEQFLDTPVKRYSSGMHMRLAFSVAAHLEPEILIVDEVLAVGDAIFQSKCLGKMHEVAQNKGRTVLFVSHNLSAVRQLTTRCLVLEKGNLAYQGCPESAISQYLQHLDTKDNDVENQVREFDCAHDARFVELKFKTQTAVFSSGIPIDFIAVLSANKPVNAAFISLTILTQESFPVGSGFSASSIQSSSAGKLTFSVSIPPMPLAPGRYHCTVALSYNSGGMMVNIDAVSNVLPFEIFAGGLLESNALQWASNWGALRLPELKISPLE